MCKLRFSMADPQRLFTHGGYEMADDGGSATWMAKSQIKRMSSSLPALYLLSVSNQTT